MMRALKRSTNPLTPKQSAVLRFMGHAGKAESPTAGFEILVGEVGDLLGCLSKARLYIKENLLPCGLAQGNELNGGGNEVIGPAL